MTPQWAPTRPAGQPEGDAARVVMLDRLLRERFPSPRARRAPRLDDGAVPLWDGVDIETQTG